MRPGEALRIVLRSGSGRLGLAMLAVLVFVSVMVPFFYPLDFGLRFWNNPIAWADNPKGGAARVDESRGEPSATPSRI